VRRYGISRLPEIRDKPVKKKFKQYPIGYFHLDIAEVSTDRRDGFICLSLPVAHRNLLTPNCILIKRAIGLVNFYDN
jgi:hypothetical protein